MDAKLTFVDRLLTFERRVCRIYESWAAHSVFSSEVRSFFNDMAQEEKQHLAILERSAALLNFAPAPPLTSSSQLEKIEATIATAEQVSDTLTLDEALAHALALESSELNLLDDAWLRGFHPDLEKITQAKTPVYGDHIRRLSDAARRFTANQSLQKKAAALLSAYVQQRTDRKK